MTAGQAAKTAAPIYCRTEGELRAPFAAGRTADELSSRRSTVRDLRDPFLAIYRSSGDAGTFARNWAATLRGFTEEIFFGPDRGMADAYYGIVETLVDDWHIADVVFSRR